MKSVQIPYDLFVALVEYHLAYDDDYAEEIHRGLEQKLDAMVRHELYAKYKTAPTAEEREHGVGLPVLECEGHPDGQPFQYTEPRESPYYRSHLFILAVQELSP